MHAPPNLPETIPEHIASSIWYIKELAHDWGVSDISDFDYWLGYKWGPWFVFHVQEKRMSVWMCCNLISTTIRITVFEHANFHSPLCLSTWRFLWLPHKDCPGSFTTRTPRTTWTSMAYPWTSPMTTSWRTPRLWRTLIAQGPGPPISGSPCDLVNFLSEIIFSNVFTHFVTHIYL